MNHTSPAPRRTSRSRGAAPLAAVIGTLATLAACGGGADPGTTEEPAHTSTSPAAATELTLPSSAPGRCLPPNVRTLRLQDIAFEGTVVEVSDDAVTLAASRWYEGEETDRVVVTPPSAAMVELGYGVAFEEGATYLVSASDGQVTLCGFTAESSAELERLYEKAYA